MITIFVAQLLFVSISAVSASAQSDSLHTPVAQHTSEAPVAVSDTVSHEHDSPLNSSSIVPEEKPEGTTVHTTSAKPDSLIDTLREAYRDSLIKMEHARAAVYEHPSSDLLRHDFFTLSPSVLFRTDGTAPSEALRFHPLFSNVRFGISSSLNRFLPLGNVAPVNKIYTGDLLYSLNNNPVAGTDQIFATEISHIHLLHNGNLRYSRYPGNVSVPEAVLFWENGVFGENIVNVRFSRPLSKQLMINAFSNFRHFDGKSFSHDGNDVFSFYSNLFDTTKISHKGYTPLIDEHMVGLGVAWSGKNSSSATINFKYGDMTNEIALNTPKPLDRFDHAMYRRYPLSFHLGSSLNLPGPYFLDLEGLYKDEPVVRLRGVLTNDRTVPVRTDARDKTMDAAVRTGRLLFGSDSAGVQVSLKRNAYQLFDESSFTALKTRPELFYNLNFNRKDISGSIDAGGGMEISAIEDSLQAAPVWHAGMQLTRQQHSVRFYLSQDNIPFSADLDSLHFNQELLDSYFKAGLELFWNWNKAELLLGYQYINDVSESSVNKAWPLGIAPYQQPRSVLTVAPGFGRWHGLAFRASAHLSDRKPYLKARGALSFIAHPMHTREYIDMTLSFDYWSERDDISFAGYDDWNRPVYNLNFEMAAHIRSFRLFYKVDNLLNQRYAYVPGYYSPGVTFRWGFNWFIQR